MYEILKDNFFLRKTVLIPLYSSTLIYLVMIN
jgi:hypothetical protein